MKIKLSSLALLAIAFCYLPGCSEEEKGTEEFQEAQAAANEAAGDEVMTPEEEANEQ